MPERTFAVFLALVLAGCSAASADPPHIGEHDPSDSTGASGETAAGPRAEDTGRERLHFDLAAHVARAELRHGMTLVMDHGVPGGAKYTLGGWMTNVGDDRVVDGASVMLVPGTTAKLNLPRDTDGPQTLAIRARALAPGRLTVYVAGAVVGRSEIAADGAFHVVRVDLEERALARGENTLTLRAASTGVARGIGSASLAIDWVKIGPREEGGDGAQPPAPSALSVRDGNESALALPSGWSLGYALEVPAAARLRAVAKGDGPIEVVAQEDGAAARVLGTVNARPNGALVDVDLAAMAGHVARIDLRTRANGIRLVRPRVVTLDAARGPAAQAHVRNVVVYLIDTLRADKLRPYNANSRVRTPGLGRFVEHAALLRGHTQENWTKPSVATLLSSLMPWDHHAVTTEAVVPASIKMLPEVLQDHGFYTGAFIANGYVSDRFGFRQGWSTYRNYVREGRRNRAQFVAADVLEWLDHRPQDKPFFLYVHAIDPHVPYVPPQDFLQMYDPDPYNGVVSFARDNELLEKIKSGSVHVNARDRRRLEALYDGEISYHDVHFNAIMDALARRGLADDTMIVITADHGEEFWDHGSVGHGHSVYEELLRIPLVVRVPGVTPRTVALDDSVGLVDVMPTILDAVGQPIPEEAVGRSFLPMLRGEGSGAPRATVSGFMDGWRTVVAGRMKLIHRTVEHMTMYDLTADPGEEHDLVAGHPITTRYLRGLLGLALAVSDDDSSAAHGRPRRTVHRAETTTIDPETEAQLRALGYVGSSRR